MSPYEDTDSASSEYLKKLCEGAHGKFVDMVKRERGNKLKPDELTFSGEVFTGEEALTRGLVDELGSMIQVL